mgnify:CR=1 FL=1
MAGAHMQEVQNLRPSPKVASIHEVFSQFTDDEPELLTAHLTNLLQREKSAMLPENLLENVKDGSHAVQQFHWQLVADWMIDVSIYPEPLRSRHSRCLLAYRRGGT